MSITASRSSSRVAVGYTSPRRPRMRRRRRVRSPMSYAERRALGLRTTETSGKGGFLGDSVLPRNGSEVEKCVGGSREIAGGVNLLARMSGAKPPGQRPGSRVSMVDRGWDEVPNVVPEDTQVDGTADSRELTSPDPSRRPQELAHAFSERNPKNSLGLP